MRTKIKHEVKKTELIENIWNLFLTQGYEKCTMTVILKFLDISKGEFYHYFQSKEDCAKVCAKFYAENCLDYISSSMHSESTPINKLFGLIQAGSTLAEQNTIQQINSASNHIFHQMVMAQLVILLAPVYADVFQEGNDMGEWKVSMPLETAEMFLTLSNFYLDDAVFGWKEDQMAEKTKACILFLAKMLEIEMIELEKMFKTYQR